MNNFTYTRAGSLDEGIQEVASNSHAKFIAGGTNLLDLMKENVSRPDRLVDINRLSLTELKNLENGGVELGALMTNADTAYHPEIEKRYPLLSKAILAGASPQLRNMATNGGICCSVLAVITSTIGPHLVTNVSRAVDALPFAE